jgi:hypothetical protein
MLKPQGEEVEDLFPTRECEKQPMACHQAKYGNEGFLEGTISTTMCKKCNMVLPEINAAQG